MSASWNAVLHVLLEELNNCPFGKMKYMEKILMFLSVLTACTLPASAGNTPAASIPFELGTASRIYVKGSVNGSRPLRFLFDTGATSMVTAPIP